MRSAKKSNRENLGLLCHRMRLNLALISSFSLRYIIWWMLFVILFPYLVIYMHQTRFLLVTSDTNWSLCATDPTFVSGSIVKEDGLGRVPSSVPQRHH